MSFETGDSVSVSADAKFTLRKKSFVRGEAVWLCTCVVSGKAIDCSLPEALLTLVTKGKSASGTRMVPVTSRG